MINLIYTILCIACLCIGFFCGLKMNTKPTEHKVVNPIKKIKQTIQEKKDDNELQEQLDELNRIYENIENYDGTSESQKELRNIEIKL